MTDAAELSPLMPGGRHAPAPVKGSSTARPTLLVHLDLDADNGGVLAVAAQLAERLNAGVIGVAVRQPVEMTYVSAHLSGELIDLDRELGKQSLAKAEAEFLKGLGDRAPWVQWRGVTTTESLADHVAREARAADLILTGPDVGVGFANSSVRMSVGDLVMRAGRPVLIVPDAAKGLDLEHVLVAWKDTREARRAIADALPLLALAGEVTVVEIADPDDMISARERLADVALWLERHGITASVQVVEAERSDSTRLAALARSKRAGLVVAGAYGRTRLLEWVFGGVTCDLMMHPARCTLLSH
jgi:nucleotide-binding universal stress UspA family protein